MDKSRILSKALRNEDVQVSAKALLALVSDSERLSEELALLSEKYEKCCDANDQLINDKLIANERIKELRRIHEQNAVTLNKLSGASAQNRNMKTALALYRENSMNRDVVERVSLGDKYDL